ncbi:uridine diphosphate-N-acetylglucosamine-binding protein YvcK [Candidatus Uhrbacteria bacterium]|nr:uridine diphosphate-N-acetylglucosamine-binding protein YvcK [Candidatus Uhrbacteria bacterium]
MNQEAKKRIVVIGGGNGTAVCLQALKPQVDEIELNAVISTSDSGGSSGRLRRELRVIPTGDIMRAVLSLSRYDYALLKSIFYKNRFADAGALDQHNLGNLFLALGGKYGTITDAVRALEQAVEAVGRVYPVSMDLTDLCVELASGEVIKGEAEIDVPQYDRSKKIVKAWLEPEAAITKDAKQVIESADYICFGPGSLYTSIIPNMLVGGAAQALAYSKAKLVYIIGSCYEADGETGPEKLSDFAAQLQKYLPRPLDAVIYSTHEFSAPEKRELEKKRWRPMVRDKDNVKAKAVLGADFEKEGGGGDPKKLGPFLKDYLAV